MEGTLLATKERKKRQEKTREEIFATKVGIQNYPPTHTHTHKCHTL
jgi:hypothetical protein